MAEHNIFLGGNRTKNCGFYEMLPSEDAYPDQAMTPATHKEAALHSLTRHLDWKAHDHCPKTGASQGSRALSSYLDRNEIQEGDILNLVIMPRHSSLTKIWWHIDEALEGFTFDLQVRGNAKSLGGTDEAPQPIVLAEDVDGSVEPMENTPCNLPSGLIGIDPSLQGDANAEGIYFDQNDMLQLVVKTLPEEGIRCSAIRISPVIETYCEGSY